ncbi:TonB-dependent receptor [Lutimonas saemankumensis]|uniref:TonB-dependent receptor n=1 Tax=Lutimonas saemankumensis TaxID=483016 RepID=UPI001CD351F2|nr:TonB-dependent receptor [Lutimonas saemankumensis]MCA0932921.1 TonB-dependent receptor [Lutimonas saemankumensis]
MKRVILILSAMLLWSSGMFAQTGELSGKVIDKEYNDVLPFANVIVKENGTGTTTDFEGAYSIKLEPGVYTVVFSFIGYETAEISEVVIKENEITEVNASIGPLSNELEEVVVKATTQENTEASLLNVQKKSINLLDGISAQTFSKIGASNSAKAVKSVPGVSVQGGKYVYVRGLGDRYTKSILNGVDIPGLDPDRNTIQMDIFPTNILDNIQVVKSFTADYPADFTGGTVNIITKDFPNKEEYSVSIGAEYNPSMHFNKDYLGSAKSNSELLGFDGGLRSNPIPPDVNIPPPSAQNPATSYWTSQFNPEMAAKRETSFMNTNLGLTAGNLYDVGKGGNKLGYQFAGSYRNDYIYYEDYKNGNWRKFADKSINEMDPDKLQNGDLAKNNILWNVLAGLTFKTDKSKYKLSGLHIQNGVSTAGYLRQEILFSDAVTIFKDNLEYTQSQITNLLLNGKHSNEDGTWNIEWKLSPTLSKINDKDIRVAPFEYDSDTGDYFLSPSSAGSPLRIWRDLEEVNLVGKLDLTKRHDLFGRSARLLFGGQYTYKQRDFTIQQYQIRYQGGTGVEFEGDADEILNPKNIWTVSTRRGTFAEGNFEPTNTFDANMNVAAAYVSEEFQITDKLKSIIGLRFEKFDLYYTGTNNQGDVVLDNEKILDKADLFPSANFIYALNDESNLRLAYGRTTARPSFKEASITQIFDPISSTTFNGNIDLQPTYVDNLDLRWERFGEQAQMFAVSLFYKNFKDPIELSYFLSASDQFIPVNTDKAQVYGAEFEMRKNFGFIGGESWEDFSFNLNFSLIESQLEMSDAEYERRLLSARDGETISDTREMQGQSPYLVNFGLNYANDENGWQTSLFYNVQGKTLQVVGTGDVPDAYTMPFNSLDFILNKSFGEDFSSNISFSVKNLLDSQREVRYQSYGAEDQIFSSFSPGMGISLGYSYRF